jgi:CelD/BcsL family acetyltransferase involved in cellulose biosynthesis
MEIMLLWKSQQLEATKKRNPFSSLAARTLFADYATDYPSASRVYAVHINGKPIAINFLLEGDRRLVLYQMAYDSGPTSKSSPGRLLLNHIMEEVIGEKHVLLDFSIGDAPYKLELCDTVGGLTNSIALHGVTGLPAVLKERAWIGLKSLLKSPPARETA